jgi:hypothetical protein
LENKKGFLSPYDYICNNEILLENPKFKSDISFFIDNFFGADQLGGVDKYNTFYKYSYQQKVNLTEKIKKFKEKNLKYNEIKERINNKANKIISFGQTPFKLFDNKHPQWKPKKEKKYGITFDKDIYNINEKFVNICLTTNNYGKQIFYVITDNDNLIDIKYYEKAIKEKNFKIIKLKKRVKLCSKIYLNENKNKKEYIYKYNPKFIMIDFDFTLFILGRLRDPCFYIFTKNGEYFSYFSENIIITIAKSKKNRFFVGQDNGKIIEYEVLNFDSNNMGYLKDIKIYFKRNFLAHKKKVSGIYYYDLFGIIISTGDDKKIYIRKYYDLTILTAINIDSKLCYDIKINHYHLYTLMYDTKKKQHLIEVYSVNGCVVAQSEPSLINNIEFDKDGNLLAGYIQDNKVVAYNPALTKKLKEINLEKPIPKTDNKKDNKEKTVEDSKFLNFIYNSETSSIYCYSSNGSLIKIDINQ